MIKAVIFDMDGLLIDSEPLWTKADSQLLALYGKEYPQEEKSHLMGSGAKEFVKLLKERFCLPESEKEIAAQRMIIFQSLLDKNLKLRPGASDLLKRLLPTGYLLALATGNTRQMMDLLVKKLNLEKYFLVTISSDEVARGKPAPDIFFEAARRLKVRPGECLVLEDAINGICAAKAAEMKTIAVCDRRFNRPKNYPTADLVVESLKEIDLETIKMLGEWSPLINT